MLEALVKLARSRGASDLHLESGLPPVVRVDGQLKVCKEAPVNTEALPATVRSIIGESNWPAFLEQCSYDLSTNIAGVRCRINAFRTLRGIGLAVRLLSSFQPTIEKLNLIPDLLKILSYPHGLVIVSGPTGCGTSSTLAALIQEINLRQAKHIITIESPIEYQFNFKKAFIRQREAGRDTPTFYRGLVDAMREDPDVIMVGEMREAEVMRQTLNAAETGHLVLTTLHSGSVVEALQRIVSAFPAEFQTSVRSQLADTLLAVVCQRLVYLPEPDIRVPECEILFANLTAKAVIREGKFFRLKDVIQTGADEKMYSFERYRRWLDNRTVWYYSRPDEPDAPVDESSHISAGKISLSPPRPLLKKKSLQTDTKRQKKRFPPSHGKKAVSDSQPQDYFEIGEVGNDEMKDILKTLDSLKPSKKQPRRGD